MFQMKPLDTIRKLLFFPPLEQTENWFQLEEPWKIFYSVRINNQKIYQPSFKKLWHWLALTRYKPFPHFLLLFFLLCSLFLSLKNKKRDQLCIKAGGGGWGGRKGDLGFYFNKRLLLQTLYANGIMSVKVYVLVGFLQIPIPNCTML